MFKVCLIHTPDNVYWFAYFYDRPTDVELYRMCRTLTDGMWGYFSNIECIADV